MSYSSANTIKTVAAREIQVAAKNRGIMISMALTLLIVIGGIIAASYFSDRVSNAEAPVVATTAPAMLEGAELEVSTVDDRASAEEAVLNGDAKAALVEAEEGAGDSGWELLAEGMPSASISETVSAALQANASHLALTELGVDPAEFAAATGDTTLTPVDVSGGVQSASQFVTVLIAMAGIFVLLFAVILFAANVGSRVTEEKSSRVVELILASVRPMDFLTGKILGNVLFGLLCTVLILVAAGIGLQISGLLDGLDFDWTILPLLAVSFVLGLVFFGSLYAAAGAMVQRTEDLQSTQGPIMILILATMYVPMFGWNHTGATWMQIMGWIPPISTMTAPLMYAAGEMSLWEVLASFGIMVVVTILAIWLVARIYRAAILNNGQKLSWVKALRATPA